MVASDILEAAEDGNISLLESFGDVVNQGVVDEIGCNCLHYAARQGGREILQFLVQKRGFNASGRSNIGATALHDAAAAGNLEAVKWLLDHTSCDVNDQDGTGATILHLACRFHHTHVSGWLLDVASPSVTTKTASGGLPLHFAVVGRDYEATKLLLDEDPMTANSQTGNGATATYLAAQEGQEEILRLLIQDYRGNVKMKAYDGMSCLHAAAQTGHLNCVKFLVSDEKCNANERDFDGATPLHYSASQGHHKVIDWLMKVGGAKITLDNIGGSPLHNAAETNQLECVKVLIDNGCRADITDNNGLTAAELARKCFNDKCANLIETYKPNRQEPLDADLVYLASVQSPRPPITVSNTHTHDSYLPAGFRIHTASSAYTQGYYGNGTVVAVGTGQSNQSAPPVTPSSEVEEGYQGREGYRRRSAESYDHWQSEETGESESVVARIDSEECLAGLERNFSEDNLDGEFTNRQVKVSRSSSNSSLSSLSHLDEVVAVAFREYEKDALLEKKKVEKDKQVTSVHVTQQAGSHTRIIQSKPQTRNLLQSSGYNYLSPLTEAKNVRFQTDQNSDSAWSHRQRGMEPEQDTLYSEVKKRGENGSAVNVANGRVQNSAAHPDNEMVNGNGNISDSESESSVDANGSVVILQRSPELSNPHSMHNSISHSISANTNVACLNEQNSMNTAQTLVNGSNTDTLHPVPTIRTTVLSVSNPVQESNNSDILPIVTKTSFSTQTVENTTSASVPIAPPPPPPPAAPPVPPLPPPQVNGSGNHPLPNGTSVQEAKAKSASLPARPVSLFTTEMIQSKRNTLSPAPAKNSEQRNSGKDFDFVAELKKATKDTSKLKSAKVSDSSKPLMVFSAGKKTVNGTSNNKSDDDKDGKVELTGEWDPKNFVDKVPNKDTLPSWKVQLQARQLAEKTMKETLEKRKTEEREARFKNMPAWKRALVEKKEAEAKAAEEKRLQQEQQQQQKKTNRRVPSVNVTPKPAQGGSTLAPWQMELNNK